MKNIFSIILVLIAITLGVFLYRESGAQLEPEHRSSITNKSHSVNFDKNKYSLSDPTSIWYVVNKSRPLSPTSYVPTDLVVPNIALRVPGNESMQIKKTVADAMETMFSSAKTAGAPLMLSSGYRSFSYQTNLYDSYVASDGQTKADTYSARPGYSEHQTGWSFDVEPLDKTCEVEVCFAETSAGKWVAAHAYEYGFIIRYPADKVAITGFQYEPWHLRYVGKDLSVQMHDSHTETLEEFFGLPAAPDYLKH